MDFVQNFPFFSIFIAMLAAIISSVLNGKQARRLCMAVLFLVLAMSFCLFLYLVNSGESYVFLMGHFPAPWGNEIRAGILEALVAMFFSLILFAAVTGGMVFTLLDIEEDKLNLYFVLVNLMLSSLLALVFTNDIFTAYVFIEINTIAGCGLIMIRQAGKTIVTAVRYMIVSLLGSGIFLIATALLYTVTGHLLMENIRDSVAALAANSRFILPLTVIIALMTVGLAIKSGLFPFHMWIPDAYGFSTVSSSALLSGVVSKGYIFLLIKIYYRVLGIDSILSSHILNILFVFGIAGMIMGSVSAIREKGVRRIIAYSSVAQIGYIYMGIGLGCTAGFVAALFHIFSHGATKALLFLASSKFTEGSHTKVLKEITGLGLKYKFEGIAFFIGALSMVGFPLLSGFISKLLFSVAATQTKEKMLVALFALAISTVLNTIYFLRIVITLFTPTTDQKEDQPKIMAPAAANEETKPWDRKSKGFAVAVSILIVLNFALGMFSQPITDLIEKGLSMLG